MKWHDNSFLTNISPLEICLCQQVFKVTAIIFTFFFILVGTVLTKLTVLIAASNIQPVMKMHCIRYRQFDFDANETFAYDKYVLLNKELDLEKETTNSDLQCQKSRAFCDQNLTFLSACFGLD